MAQAAANSETDTVNKLQIDKLPVHKDSLQYGHGGSDGITSVDARDDVGVGELGNESVSRPTHTCPPATQETLVPDFSCLPDVVWVQVFQMLSLEDRYYLSLACSRMLSLFNHPSVWRRITLMFNGQHDHEQGIQRPVSCLSLRKLMVMCKYGQYFQFLKIFALGSYLDTECYDALLQLGESQNIKRVTFIVNEEECLFDVSEEVQQSQGLPHISEFMSDFSARFSGKIHVEADICVALRVNDGIQRICACPASDPRCMYLRSLTFTSSFTEEDLSALNPLLMTATPTVALIAKFPSLQHLSLSAFNCSDDLLHELSSMSHRDSSLRTLMIEFHEVFGDFLPELSVPAWEKVVLACPKLEVSCFITASRLRQVLSVIRPITPLTSIKIRIGDKFTGQRCDPVSLARLIMDHCSSLSSMEYTEEEHPRLVFPGEEYKLSLVALVTACPKLQHIIYDAKIHHQDIIQLALLNRQWRTFEFRGQILMGMNEATTADRLPGDDKTDGIGKLNELWCVVSQHLGYMWNPCNWTAEYTLNPIRQGAPT